MRGTIQRLPPIPTTSMTDIISDNALSPGEHQVYVDASAGAHEFAYSDGEEVEQYLESVFNEVEDLSISSTELQDRIIDWPTEYHLSADRANLLRPYNLNGVERVLELGSGCGAISRYLGELGKQVDAIEGSAVRARLGRMRCRGLDNVRVINANYNDLSIPEQHYDLVLFVGVIEYASQFHPDARSDREAAEAILRNARRLLAPNGVVLVAIENRLGMKYQLGAHEDHYGKRYIGIDGYQNSAGIATYSAPEWRSLAQDAGYQPPLFSYSFPDYKLPKVVVSQQYAERDAAVSNHLEGLVSRDYHAPVVRSITETICWQAAASGGYLGDVANSYVLLLGEDTARLQAIQDFDFCHGPGRGRDLRFAVMTKKLTEESVVRKQSVVDPDTTLRNEGASGVRQILVPDTYYSGQLLSARWLRDIAIYVRRQEFEQNLRAYYQYLREQQAAGELCIDLLPINIIVGNEGGWSVFDQEWQVDWPLTAPYLLFRALLTFIVSNWVYLGDFLRWLELQTVRDFIEYGFHANQIHLTEHLSQFVEQETRFQRAISSRPDDIDVEGMLNTVFDFAGKSGGPENPDIYSTLWWRGADETWESSRSVTEVGQPDPALHTRSFALDGAGSVSAIRLDPFDLRKPDDVGYFSIAAIRLVAESTERSDVIWSLDDPSALAEHSQCDGAVFEQGVVGKILISTWIATSDFPKLMFSFDQEIRMEAGRHYRIEIDLSIARTAEYILAYRNYVVRGGEGDKHARHAEMNRVATTQELTHRFNYELARMQGDLEIAERNTQSHLAEVNAIKNSRSFKLGKKISGLIAPFSRRKGR